MAGGGVEAGALTKRYGDPTAVHGIDFAIRPGACVGFLGPNGAGKTTTVRMVSCFTPLTSGVVTVLGRDVSTHPREVKRSLGICPQEDDLDPDSRVERDLLVHGRYFDTPRPEAKARSKALLGLMQLEEERKVEIDELSGGMKRRDHVLVVLRERLRILRAQVPPEGIRRDDRDADPGRGRDRRRAAVG